MKSKCCTDAILTARQSLDYFKGRLALFRMTQDKARTDDAMVLAEVESKTELCLAKDRFVRAHALASELVAATDFESNEGHRERQMELLGLKYAFDILILPKGI